MATPANKLAEALKALHSLQEQGVVAIKSNSLTRVVRERLLTNGFIKEVYKGVYMIKPPDELPGDSTSWYHSFWKFASQLLEEKYQNDWYISPEQSLLIHSGNWTVPTQLVIKSQKATNFSTELPYRTSLFHMASPLPVKNEIIEVDGVRLLSLPASLIYSSPTIFISNPTDVRTALSMIKDSSEVLGLLLDGEHTVIAGRLAGALRNIGQEKIADDILKSMQKASFNSQEVDPFQGPTTIALARKVTSPYSNRIMLMWQQMRDAVITHFPEDPGQPEDIEGYMQKVEGIYVTDAYHSLSIERYRVTPDLIENVRSGNWNAEANEADRKQREAMAAKGYWETFKLVEHSIRKVFSGANAGEVAGNEHGDWYRELFGPSVAAGILKASDLAGYRNDQVYISQSKHIPLPKEAVRDAMPTLFQLLAEEKVASVRAVLGHFIFVYIHPYMDGNGRMARFLMNLMLASGGFSWTVIPVQERDAYMNALEMASANQDIAPFAAFMGHLVSEGMKGRPVAKI
ncbi:MAG: Fic family protein [Sediminibacterium sp.]